MSRIDALPVPSAFPTLESVTPQNLDTFSVFRMRPSGICVIKLHKQNKKSLNQTQQCCAFSLGSKASIGYSVLRIRRNNVQMNYQTALPAVNREVFRLGVRICADNFRPASVTPYRPACDDPPDDLGTGCFC